MAAPWRNIIIESLDFWDTLAFLTSLTQTPMVVISLGGTELPIYLLDGTRFMMRIMPTTLAGAVMVSLRERIGLVHDTHYGIFEAGEDGEFRLLDDRVVLSKVVARWSSMSGACPARQGGSLLLLALPAAALLLALAPLAHPLFTPLSCPHLCAQAPTPSTCAESCTCPTASPLRRSCAAPGSAGTARTAWPT